ncbi:5'-methylthioadenosine/S-adenosylhomocysteine nucleosidase [uncultured Fusobacterium sp.]|uniref:5'-methylthioadenosine/S-adenosylhomocysteine nucleosidase n=1 Tax=uncultured Fusobacterium sp. TaxID=159267 RepID=UPI0025FD5E1D|nr:5'-methylthioadenosine/S-adenosylhomocysteine nucleosidase [uncultured Fusobacterium sp.]
MKKIILGLFILTTSLFAKETILVQGAMDIETEYLIKALSNPVKEQIASWTFWKGEIGNKTVIVSRTEIGITNASAATTIGIMKYSPNLIINQGTSGGHDPKLHAGDIVLAEKVINIGAVRTERKEYGIPADDKDGIFFEDVQRIRDSKGNTVDYPYFSSEKKIIDIAKKIDYKNGKIVVGTIGTADQWNRELERIKFIHERYNTSAEEMETVAAAQVAKAFNIPFMGVRILSNTDIHNEDFNPQTAIWCQEYMIELIKKLDL